MMLDSDQGRLWTAHGKALGDDLSASVARLRKTLSGARMRGVAELIAVTTVFSLSLGLASLIALQFADGSMVI